MKQRVILYSKNIVIILGVVISFLIGAYTLVVAEELLVTPTIQWSSGSNVVYMKGNEQNISLSGYVNNYDDANVTKIVWTDAPLASLDSEEAKNWAKNENNNCAYLNGGNFYINLSNLNVTFDADFSLYYYPVKISTGTSSSGNNGAESAVQIYNPSIVTFKIDNVAPVAQISAEKIKNPFYYNNSYLDIKIEATDSGLGVQYVDLYVKRISRSDRENNIDINNIEPTKYVLNHLSVEEDRYIAEYDLYLEPKEYEYIIYAVASDGKNRSEVVYLTDMETGIIYEADAPAVSIAPQEEVAYQRDDYYFDKVHHSFDINIKDEFSGISFLEVKINENKITTQYGSGAAIAKDYDAANTKELNLVINTSQATANENGIYTINVTVSDYAGNETQEEITLRIDEAAPTIENIIWNQNSYDDSAFAEVGDKYNNFGNEKTQVVIHAADDENGSGVKTIKYYFEDSAGNSTDVASVAVDDSGEATFEIEPDFKGFIYAVAVDNLGNETEEYITISGMILEKQETHDLEEHIAFQLAATDKKDNQGNPLYSADTSATLIVKDDYAGIKEIEWSVSAPNDTGCNDGGMLKIDEEGKLDSKDWEVITEDLNLVTSAQIAIPITHNSNDIVIKVKMTDNVGNVTEKETKLSIDKTAPVIQITFDNKTPDATYTDIYNSARTATITVKERNFNAGLMSKTISNTLSSVPEISNWTESKDANNPDNTVYTATITFAADGDYTFSMSGSDMAGNQAAAVSVPNFTIDLILPEITVSYSQEGQYNQTYYSVDRVITISVKERNFAPERVTLQGGGLQEGVDVSLPAIGEWSQQGDTYTTSIVLSADATYSFTVDVSDKAGNAAVQYQSESFTVDKTYPTIIFTNIEDKSANNGEVAPVIEIQDVNFDASTTKIQLTGANSGEVELKDWYVESESKTVITFNDFKYEQELDDLYVLEVSSTDMAGNTTTESITFSVNRYGSVYIFNNNLQDISGTYVKTATGLGLTEINVDLLLDDTIQLVLTANGVPKTLEEGIDYEIKQSGEEGSWRYYEYTLKDELFKNDGTYILTVYSEDVAGNINQNTDELKEAEIEFGVDSTNPVIVPINLEAEKMYDASVYRANISVKDNLVLANVKAYINEKEILVDESGESFYFDIPEANERQIIRIVAVDAAGNEAECVIDEILVSSNFFVRWYNNKPVFWMSLILGFGISFMIIFLIVKRRKKEKNEKL